MKNKMILIGSIVLMAAGISSAQYCPTPIGMRSVYSNGISSNAYFTLYNFTNDVSRALVRGFNSGDLTQHEVNVLKGDLRRLQRRIQRAYFDRRLSNSEWSFIEFDMRDLQRDLKRELNDNDLRLS